MLPSQKPFDADVLIALHAERNMSAAAIAVEFNLPLADVQSILDSDHARHLIATLRRLSALRAEVRAAEDRRRAIRRTLEIAQDRTNETLALRACIALLNGRTLPEPKPRAPRTSRRAHSTPRKQPAAAATSAPVPGSTPLAAARPELSTAVTPQFAVPSHPAKPLANSAPAPISAQRAEGLLPGWGVVERVFERHHRSPALLPRTPEGCRSTEPRLPPSVLAESSAPLAPASASAPAPNYIVAPAPPSAPRRHSRSRECQPAGAMPPSSGARSGATQIPAPSLTIGAPFHAHRRADLAPRPIARAHPRIPARDIAFPHIRARDAPPLNRAA